MLSPKEVHILEVSAIKFSKTLPFIIRTKHTNKAITLAPFVAYLRFKLL